MKEKNDPFAQWNTLHAYAACIQTAVDSWRSFFHTFQPERFPKNQIDALLDRTATSIAVLKNRYAYDTLHSLNISPIASGFPFRYDVRMTEVDHIDLMHQKQEITVSSQELKNALVSNVFSQKHVNLTLLEKISKTISQEILLQSEPLQIFQIRSIAEVDATNGCRAYLCLWERFNYNNVPSLYTMLFEYHSDDALTQDVIAELAIVLREETTQMPLLEKLGQHIDYAMANVHPKRIGRLTFGPIFISHMTQDDIPLQHVLNDVFEADEHIAASRIIYEYVVSEKEEPMNSLRDPSGRKHIVLQKFAVRHSDDECRVRGVTHVEKFLFAPHSVIQMLNADYRKEIGHQIIGG